MNVIQEKEATVASTNDVVLVNSNFVLCGKRAQTIAIAIRNESVGAVDYQIVGSFNSDLSHYVVIDSGTVVANDGAIAYATSLPPYLYYGVTLQSSSLNTPGTVTINGVCKG